MAKARKPPFLHHLIYTRLPAFSSRRILSKVGEFFMAFSEMLVLLYLQRVTNVAGEKRVQNVDSDGVLQIFAWPNAIKSPD
jgi:hypothetical protein